MFNHNHHRNYYSFRSFSIFFAFVLFATIFSQQYDLNKLKLEQNNGAKMRAQKSQKIIKVLTFNTWLSGDRVEDGFAKIVYHIKKIDADIVALQEVTSADFVSKLTDTLGTPWNVAFHDFPYPDTVILTKHTFVNNPKIEDILVYNTSDLLRGMVASCRNYQAKKCLLFFTQFILWVIGLCLIVVGIYLHHRYIGYRLLNFNGYFGGHRIATSVILFISGSLCIILGFVDFCGPIHVVYGTAATIQLDTGPVINFFSMHLNYQDYGPYVANNKHVTTVEQQIIAGERNKYGNGRAQNIEALLKNARFREFMNRIDKEPLIVAGDFNSPSHQDWTEETKDIHGGWVVEWPVTKQMTDAGFIDSYRLLHSDVNKNPGYTWSTVQKDCEWDNTIPEPQDRVDFIFYRGPKDFEPISSRTYKGIVPLMSIPNVWRNSFPSDHYAVITEFTYGDNLNAYEDNAEVGANLVVDEDDLFVHADI